MCVCVCMQKKIYWKLISGQSYHCQAGSSTKLFCSLFPGIAFWSHNENVPEQDGAETGVRTHSKACVWCKNTRKRRCHLTAERVPTNTQTLELIQCLNFLPRWLQAGTYLPLLFHAKPGRSCVHSVPVLVERSSNFSCARLQSMHRSITVILSGSLKLEKLHARAGDFAAVAELRVSGRGMGSPHLH